MSDNINQPAHYRQHPSGIECIEISEWHTFAVGNAIKYLWRAGLKDTTTATEDYRKAIWYLQREVSRLERLAAAQPQRGDDDLRAAIQRLEAGNQKEDAS